MRIYLVTSLLMFVYAFFSCSALPWKQEYVKSGKGDYTYLSPSKFWNKGLDREPNCKELRAMWRFSKLKSRSTEMTNEIPMYKDPFAYNVWETHARTKHLENGVLKTGLDFQKSSKHVYGKIIHSEPHNKYAQHSLISGQNFDDVSKFLASSDKAITPRRKNAEAYRLPSGAVSLRKLPSLTYSFQKLKAAIRAQKAKELQELQSTETRSVLKDISSIPSQGHNPSSAYLHFGNNSFARRPNQLAFRSLHFISNPHVFVHGPSNYYDNNFAEHYFTNDGYNRRYFGPLGFNLQFFPDQILPLRMPSRF